ncbi:T9SS type A sorting domain-containing protein [Hymenobacter psychrophilus]|uniref:Delta-60 repeat domain-containing protein/Por secretion system C-terminal sorting domain-containing protein n=1 Tax=Hymenobacter psychrophilus TaxID=651662 RepID=A0A1H3JKF2_9BACT|nr:T9SS type A sorting domain-containing protein [Hymenobacter psychrophilus]SDY40396.1 delta-60 repeat domain-containing protein/Por secretion system C-terminal sorting domain-containing protein [Hymenobacter psychrophilus]
MNTLLLKIFTGLLLFIGLAIPAHAQTLDPTFAPLETWQSATVNSTQEQPDGKLLVAGSFTRLNGSPASGLARFNADGTLDETFATRVAVTSRGAKVRRFANGQLLVTGYPYVFVGGPGIVKLNADGTLVAGFNSGSGPNGSITTVAVQPDNKILLAGAFEYFNSTRVTGLVRLNADGSVDQNFVVNLGSGFTGGNYGLGLNGVVSAIVVQADGKIVVGGRFDKVSGYAIHSLVRLNADGTVDTSFIPFPGPRPTTTAQVLALAADPRTGQLVARTASLGTEVVRLTLAGQIDPTFTASVRTNGVTVGFLESDGLVAVDAAGGVLLGGLFTSLNSTQPDRAYLLRLLPTGQVDPAFVPQRLNDQLRTVQVLANGEVLVGGSFTSYGELPQASVLRLNGTTAQALPGLRPALDEPGTVTSIAQQTDGRLLIGGRFRELNGAPASNLARLRSDGSPDATFAPASTNGPIEKILVLSDGRIVVSGRFTKSGNLGTALVARLLANGQADASFEAPGTLFTAISSRVIALAEHTNGAILIGGSSLSPNITAVVYRLLADGSLDQSYAQKVEGQVSGYLQAIKVLPDGRHYVAGSINRAGTTPAGGIVRLRADGSRDETFVPATTGGGTIWQLAVQPDNKVLIGGQFYSYNNIVRPNIARLNSDGSVDESFDANQTDGGGTGLVRDLELQPNGKVLVAGDSQEKGYLHRLNADGTVDASFLGYGLYNSSVTDLLVQPDGRLVTAGAFTQVDGQPRAGLARLIGGAVLHVGASQSAATLEAWPNPVRDLLRLRLDAAAGPRTVVLLNVLGREVYRRAATGAQMQVPVGQLAAGVYLLRVEYADGPVTRRIVVE